MDVEAIARSLRKERLCPAEVPPPSEEASVAAMLPHGPPMRLLDAVEGFDHETASLRASAALPESHFGFAGHFPNRPIFPGVLQLEMAGQAGLCLAWFLEPRRGPVEARVLKVHHAAFLAAIEPGATAIVEARVLDHDALTGRIAGQVWDGETLCSTCILEVYFV